MTGSPQPVTLTDEETTPEVPSGVATRVLRGGIVTAGVKFAGIGAALAANVLLARLIGTDDFGLFLLLVTVISFGAIVGRAGLDRALVIFIARNIAGGRGSTAQEAYRRGLRISEVASLLAAIVVFCVLFFGGEIIFDLPATSSIAAAVAVGIVLMSRLNVLADSLCGYHDQLYRSLFESQTGGLLLNAVFVLLLIPCYFLDALTLNVLMWVFVASLGSLLPVAALRLRQVASEHQDSEGSQELQPDDLSYRSMLTLCLPLMFSQLLIFVSTRTDIWIAGACFSHGDLALFGAARRLTFLVSMPLTIANLSVISSIPELYSQNRIAELQRILRVSGTLAAIPVFVVLLPVTVFPGLILSVAYGPDYVGGASSLLILCCGQMIATLTGSCGACLMMTGHHKTMIASSIVAFVALFGAGIPASMHYGSLGLSTVCAATMAGKNLWWLFAARMKLGVWTQVAVPDVRSVQGSLQRQLKGLMSQLRRLNK